jgi:hypothetical protein
MESFPGFLTVWCSPQSHKISLDIRPRFLRVSIPKIPLQLQRGYGQLTHCLEKEPWALTRVAVDSQCDQDEGDSQLHGGGWGGSGCVGIWWSCSIQVHGVSSYMAALGGGGGKAQAPLVRSHYLLGSLLCGISKYFISLTQFLSSLKLRSYNGPLGGGVQCPVWGQQGEPESEGMETWPPVASL